MKLFSAFLLAGFAFLGSGCALFSSVEHGPMNVNGQTIEEVIENTGAPDVIGGNSNYLVLGWRRVEALSILGLFTSTNEKTHAVVVDQRGNVIADVTGKENGKSLTVLGVPMMSGINLR